MQFFVGRNATQGVSEYWVSDMSEWTSDKLEKLHEEVAKTLKSLDVPKGSFEMRVNFSDKTQSEDLQITAKQNDIVSPLWTCDWGFIWISCTFE